MLCIGAGVLIDADSDTDSVDIRMNPMLRMGAGPGAGFETD